jgi:hypothetical protein
MRMKATLDRVLPDNDAEIVRRSHADAIRELQSLPAAGLVVIRNVVITNNGTAIVSHGLGREPRFVSYSVPRVAPASFAGLTVGVICELGPVMFTSGNPLDRTKVLQIGAFAFGLTITIDVLVM